MALTPGPVSSLLFCLEESSTNGQEATGRAISSRDYASRHHTMSADPLLLTEMSFHAKDGKSLPVEPAIGSTASGTDQLQVMTNASVHAGGMSYDPLFPSPSHGHSLPLNPQYHSGNPGLLVHNGYSPLNATDTILGQPQPSESTQPHVYVYDATSIANRNPGGLSLAHGGSPHQWSSCPSTYGPASSWPVQTHPSGFELPPYNDEPWATPVGWSPPTPAAPTASSAHWNQGWLKCPCL